MLPLLTLVVAVLDQLTDDCKLLVQFSGMISAVVLCLGSGVLPGRGHLVLAVNGLV